MAAMVGTHTLRELLLALDENDELRSRVDALAGRLAPLAADLTRSDSVKNALSGVWLGHRLHPLLTDLPIGAWTSAGVLDVVGGRSSRPAADRLVTLGIL